MKSVSVMTKGALGGFVCLVAGFFVVAVGVQVGTRNHSGWDPVSYWEHFSHMPSFWFQLLLVVCVAAGLFAAGYFAFTRRSRQR